MMHYGLSHPKIIKLLDVDIDNEREITYMILEYADGGTLFEKIKMETVSKKDIKRYFRDVCEGLAYLHNQKIMHRDIKVSPPPSSLKMFYSPRLPTRPSSATSALQPFSARERLSAGPTSTCRRR
jgi:serine/threonine protein kinase